MANRRFAATAALALVLGFGAGLPSGCATKSNGDTLVVAIESIPKSLDPRLGSTDGVSARIHQLAFDTLVRKDEHFEIVPHLAESFEASPDSKTFSFKLRRGVKFHDGHELTADDVKYTFDTIRSPELKSPVASAFNRLESIEAVDPYTVVFHARESYYTLLGDLVAIAIIGKGSGANGSVPEGTGPFTVGAHGEQTIDLAAFPDYFGGAPKVAKIRVKVVPQANTRDLEIRSGDSDIAINTSFSPDTVKQMQRDPDLHVVIAPGSNVAYLGVNTNDERLRDARVRKAIALGLDRDTIINSLYQGQARAADAILPPEASAYDAAAIAPNRRDLAAAKALLDAAGYPDPDGDGPQPRMGLKFTTSNSGLAPLIGQIIQEELKAIGIAIDLEQYESNTFFQRLNEGQFQLFYATVVGGNQSPDIFQAAYHSKLRDAALDAAADKVRKAASPDAAAADMATMLDIFGRHGYCTSAPVDELVAQARGGDPATRRAKLLEAYDLTSTRGALNRGRYCNPALDDLIIRAERSPDAAEKRQLYSQIQKTVSDEVPQIYLWYPANVVVARTRVGNVAIDPAGSWYFLKDVTLDAT